MQATHQVKASHAPRKCDKCGKKLQVHAYFIIRRRRARSYRHASMAGSMHPKHYIGECCGVIAPQEGTK